MSVSLQEGEVDCWPLLCPVLMCEYTAVAEGECCPRCIADPCLADNLSYDIRQTCQDPAGIMRLSGDTWHMPSSPCTTCKCKVGHNNNHERSSSFCSKMVYLSLRFKTLFTFNYKRHARYAKVYCVSAVTDDIMYL